MTSQQQQFDQILVSSRAQPIEKRVSPATLCFDKKSIYAGNNANWRLPFKDLDMVEQSAIERNVYNDSLALDQQGSGRRGGRRGHGTSDKTLILSLSGRKTITLKCTASKGELDAGAAHQLESFLENLKNAHRKVKMKMNNGKDPYATEGSAGKSRHHSRVGTTTSTTSSNKKTHGQRGRVMVTPHTQQAAALYLSPARKRPTSGAYQSPARRRSSSNNSGNNNIHNNIGNSGGKDSDQYSHFDPRYSSPPPKSKRYASPLKQQQLNNNNNAGPETTTTVGNVVRGLESPARTLNLSSKSPRNSTPTKLRSSSLERQRRGGEKKKLRSITNQLNGISGGNIKLRERLDIDDAMLAADSSEEEFDEFDDDGDSDDGKMTNKRSDKNQKQAREEESRPNAEEEVEEDKGSEARDVPKRRRLQKASGEADEEDSEDEFHDDDNGVKANLSSCKKKLKLSIEDDEDEEDEASAKEDSSKEKVEGGSERGAPKSEEAASPSSSTQAQSPKASPAKPQSTADTVLAPSPAKKKVSTKKKGSISNFFAPRQAAKQNTPKKSPKRPTADTYGGAILSTPSKKKSCPVSRTPSSASASSPATPLQPTDCSRPTPVEKQTQRNTLRYFSKESNSSAEDDDAVARKYSSGEEDTLDVNDNDENAHSKEDADVNSPYKSTFAKNKPVNSRERPVRRGVYGRTNGSRLGQSRLGQARLNNGKTSSVKRPSNRPSPNPTHRLDFSGHKAPPASSLSSLKGTLNFGSKVSPSTKTSWDKPSSHVPIDGNKEQSQPKPNIIPGIQNLGNTCYLSASLQTLFSIPKFLSDLYGTYKSQSDRFPTKKMPLTQSLLEAAVAIGVLREEDAPSISPEKAKAESKSSTSKAANPEALKKQMDVLTGKFAGYEQRDAHEFLSDLVDYLHDELAAPPPSATVATSEPTESTEGQGGNLVENKNPNEASQEKDAEEEKKDAAKINASAAAVQHGVVLPTDEYFHLNVKVCLECDSCGYSRSKNEMYRHLSVDVGEDSDLNKWTVERSLKQFFQPEKRELKCEKCDSGKTATQTMEIISCPKALLLHFKRFIVTQEMKGTTTVGNNSDGKENKMSPQPRMEMVLRKNKAKISLEESLSISSFVGKNVKIPTDKYHLRGVVHHVGNTAYSGHYTSCGKRKLLCEQASDGKAADNNTISTATDNEEQWVFFDDRVGAKKDLDYVTGSERNQRNCYMALYELK